MSHDTIATMAITTGTVGTKMDAATRINKSGGMASKQSTTRIITASTHPPKKPDIAPHAVPKPHAITAAAKPTSRVD